MQLWDKVRNKIRVKQKDQMNLQAENMAERKLFPWLFLLTPGPPSWTASLAAVQGVKRSKDTHTESYTVTSNPLTKMQLNAAHAVPKAKQTQSLHFLISFAIKSVLFVYFNLPDEKKNDAETRFFYTKEITK